MEKAAFQLGERAREEVLNKLPKESLLPGGLEIGSDVSTLPEQLLTPEQLRITALDCTDLLSEIAAGRMTAVAAMTAFGMRTAIAHQVTNCLTDFFLEQALVRAKELDDYYEQHGTVIGPLHGLPVSAKDQVTLKGKVTSLSFTYLYQHGEPERSDAQLAQILRDAGAIFFNHTTLPQTIMHLECNSPLWGRTVLPFNTNLSAGGSSGGEGAVIGFKGAPLGLGTDIGGSVRSPAANNGVYGLRPTAQRVPNAGVRTYVSGRDSVLGIVGPLAQSARDIELFMSIVTGELAAPWRKDPSLLEMPWRYPGARLGGWEGGQRPLRIGVMWDDGEVRPTRPIARVLKETVDKLKESGEVEVLAFKPWGTREGWDLIRQLYFADGGQRIHHLTDESTTQEPLDPLTMWLLDEAGPPVRSLSIHELWRVNVHRESFRKGFHEHWQKQGIDVLLCPVAPYPAPPHGTAKWWAYTSHFNLTDYPAIAFPVGSRVDPNLDCLSAEEAASYVPLSDDDRIAHEGYSAEMYANAPLSLQLVAIRNHDEELLSALEVIERITKQPK